MIKYKTRFPIYNKANPIEEVEVSRETKSCVFIVGIHGERREAKVTDYARYFDTKQQAKDFLIDSANMAVVNFENRLAAAKSDLEFAKNL